MTLNILLYKNICFEYSDKNKDNPNYDCFRNLTTLVFYFNT